MLEDERTACKGQCQYIGVVLNKISKSEYKNYYGSYDYYNSKKKYIKKWSQLIKNLKNLKRGEHD